MQALHKVTCFPSTSAVSLSITALTNVTISYLHAFMRCSVHEIMYNVLHSCEYVANFHLKCRNIERMK